MRPRYPKEKQPLPPALPPETRTVGQVVAETIKLYSGAPWRALAAGLGPGIVGVAAVSFHGTARIVVFATFGAALWAAGYVAAAKVATGARITAAAYGVAVVAVLPFLLQRAIVLPGFDLLALGFFTAIGLGVPAAMVERLGFLAALRRGLALARADFVHALGSLATLVIVIVLTGLVLFTLLQSFGDSTLKVAALLALLVLSPLFLLGAALLYYDQAARVKSPNRRRRSDADLSHAHDAHRKGRPDADGEPGATG